MPLRTIGHPHLLNNEVKLVVLGALCSFEILDLMTVFL